MSDNGDLLKDAPGWLLEGLKRRQLRKTCMHPPEKRYYWQDPSGNNGGGWCCGVCEADL